MTDRLKTVYPPKTSFCGGYNKDKAEMPIRMGSALPIQTFGEVSASKWGIIRA